MIHPRARSRPRAAELAAALGLLLARCGAGPGDYSRAVDLAADLPVAEVRRETGRIDLGTAAGREHLRRGWGPDEAEGSRTFAASAGPESELTVFLAQPRDVQVDLRCATVGGGPVAVSLLANGKPVAELKLAPGAWRHRAMLPAAALQAGNNLLTLRYAPAAGRKPGIRCDEIRFATGRRPRQADVRAAGGFLSIPSGFRVDYFVRLPTTGEAALLFDSLRANGAGAPALQVRLEAASGETASLPPIAPATEPTAIPLPTLGRGGPVRLTLFAAGPVNAEGSVVLKRPALGFRGAPAPRADGSPVASDGGEQPTAPAAGRRPNVVLYLVDTLRADHLGCYGYRRPVSPHIDAFARRATLFRHAVAQCSWTRPSMASIMTGLWPRTHGLNDRHDALAPQALTLAEILKSAGYETAGFVTNVSVSKNFGFHQGFDLYELLPDGHRGSDEVTARAARWLAERGTKDTPFFLYLHTLDPHSSYEPPSPYRERFAAGVPRDGTGSRWWMRLLRTGEIPPTPKVAAQLSDLYDAEIAWNDHSFGELVNLLERRGLWEDTVVVFLSDHGEAFQEHGDWEHGHSLHAELIDVPLILHLPGLGQGREVAAPAQHIDLLPTLLQYLKSVPPHGLQGRSLLPLMAGEAPGPAEETAVFSYLDLEGVRSGAVTTADWRLIDARAPAAALALYDRRQDPGERRDRAGERRVDAAYLRALLRTRERDRRGAFLAPQGFFDLEIREQLRALGYVD